VIGEPEFLPDGSEVVWRPHPAPGGGIGPQGIALRSSARELLFGGSAGGGKSNLLVAGPLRYIHEPTFRGILFRNTFDEIQKISDQEARPIYGALGGVPKGGTEWNFPSGARIYLSYLARDEDAYKHQGAAYQYIGFDELTHYTPFQYRYLFSRLRGKNGIPLEIRATCNPEPGWVKQRWAPWVDRSETYTGIRAESGQTLWYVTDDDGTERYVEKGTPHALSRCFVRSRLSDNPSLGVEYEAQLKSMEPVQRARLLEGDWEADYTPGLLFRRGMFPVKDAVPPQAIRVRAWDLAATEEKLGAPRTLKPDAKNDPDYSVGLLYGWAPNFGFFIEHVERVRGRPEVVRRTVETITNQDAARYGRGAVVTVIPQDPGQAGKAQAMAYADMLSAHRVMIIRPSGSKVQRAGPASATAENAGITLLRGPWNEAFLAEAEQFPKGGHDDQIDTLSDGHMAVAQIRGSHIASKSANWGGDLPDFS